MAVLEESRLRGIKVNKKKICRILSKREQIKIRKSIDSVKMTHKQ